MIRLLSGDCRDVLPTLPAESVQCCITSPPYYALRSYLDAAHPDKHREIGSESTPDEYLATMVAVFREVRRVLRRDGTCWVNMGDSYASAPPGTKRPGASEASTLNGINSERYRATLDAGIGTKRDTSKAPGIKPKDLLLMPARLALALQADGWWVRSAIVWAKPNPMPESVSDRPTSAYEMVYLLTKAARYYYDADAVREEAEYGYQHGRSGWVSGGSNGDGHRSGGCGNAERNPSSGRNLRNVWTIATHAFSEWGETSRQVRVAWDAAVDGKRRKASPDCPVHGDRTAQAASVPDGGHVAGSLSHIARNGDDPAQVLAGDYAPSVRLHTQTSEGQSSGSLPLWRSPSATLHSNQSHRTGLVPATSLPYSVSAQTGDDTGCTSESPLPDDWAARTHESSNEPDGLSDNRSSQTASHSARISHETASFSASDPSSCICEWYIEKTEKTSHFATFPPELAERCIKAGTSERGACSVCGKPWVRMTQETEEYAAVRAALKATKVWNRAGIEAVKGPGTGTNPATLPAASVTTGWSPGCQCAADGVPCTVLDPFIGAGTTALVADRLQRDVIGIDLNTQYTRMAMERCRADAPLFTSFPPAEDPEDERMADLFAGDEYERGSVAVPDERTPFRTGAAYVNQRGLPSNGAPDMAAD